MDEPVEMMTGNITSKTVMIFFVRNSRSFANFKTAKSPAKSLVQSKELGEYNSVCVCSQTTNELDFLGPPCFYLPFVICFLPDDEKALG